MGTRLPRLNSGSYFTNSESMGDLTSISYSLSSVQIKIVIRSVSYDFQIKFYYLCVKGLTEGLMSEVSPHHVLTLTDIAPLH